MKLLIYLSFCLACVCVVNTANILAIFPMPSVSHQILGDELVKALIKKGHHVTMASPYKMKEKLENYTEVVFEGMVEYKEKHWNKMMNFNNSKIKESFDMLNNLDATARIALESSGIKTLLKSDQKFDVVILEVMLCESLLVFGHIFNAPTVMVNSFGSLHTVNNMVGNSNPYAYVPNVFAALTDEMTFFQRLKNIAVSISIWSVFSIFLLRQQQNLVQEYFPEAPPLDDMMRNVSIALLNAHYSVVETPRPYMPNMIPIGGFHVQPQILPKELKDFLDGAKDGAVLFSLGSNAKSADLPLERLNAILKSFSKFPQRFLWKFEEEGLEMPKNVKITKWVPQRAVLDHPNVKAFISHGGLLSITEAVYHGVPFIGIPAFGDQQYNVANGVHKKFAIQYDMNSFSEETFTAAIKEILENPIYKQNIARRSSLLREQPVPPLDLAVYWIEHVIKYRGAPHLQSAAVKLSWWQGYLLDVIAFLVAVSSVTLYVNYLILKKCYSFVCSRCCKGQKVKSA